MRATTAAALSALLLACGGPSPERMIASARDYLAKGDRPAAIIELRNALQAQPDNGEARFLLGKASLESRDFATAEKELRRALELQQPADAVLPLLARAMGELGQPGELTQRYGERRLAEPRAQAEFQTLLGDAYLAQDDRAAAAKAYAAALAAQPDFAAARLGQAAILAAEGKRDEALARVDAILAEAPKLAAAHGLRARLLLAKGDLDGGRKALQAAIDADAHLLPPRLALIELLLAEREFDAAGTLLDSTLKVAPRDLRVNYLQAQLAFGRGDSALARERIQQVLKQMPGHPPSLRLVGAIDLQQGQWIAAEGNLRKAVAAMPADIAARKLLAMAYLHLQQPARARDALQPLLDDDARGDAQLLMLAGETLLATGDAEKAAEYFDRASKAGNEEAAAAKTRLGLIALAQGRPDEGFRQLEAAAALDSGQYQADLVMVAAHLRAKRFTEALAAAQALQKKRPDDPLTYQVFGQVYRAKGDAGAARASYEKALQLRPDYLPAAQRRRIEAIIAADRRNEQAWLTLAEVEARAGADAPTIAAAVQRAIDANPQSAAAWIALLRLHQLNADATAAAQAAQRALAALPDDPRVLAAAGQALEAAGETNRAIETYNKWAAAQPQAAAPLLRIAAVHAGRRDYDRAIEVLKRARRLQPDAPEVSAGLARAYLASGRPDEAMAEARTLRRQAPKSAAAFVLEGDVLAAQKRLPPAEGAYREALKLAPAEPRAAIGLHRTLVAEGKTAEAEAFAGKWTAAHASDTAMLVYLAQRELSAGNLKAAAGRYRAAVDRQPNDALALNNLAWVAGELGDPAALGYAERALALTPKQPAFLDTYGTLLIARGEVDKGLEALRRASELDSDNYGVRRLKYARELVRAGQKEAAQKELRVLRDSPGDFKGKDEIGKLLGSLSA